MSHAKKAITNSAMQIMQIWKMNTQKCGSNSNMWNFFLSPMLFTCYKGMYISENNVSFQCAVVLIFVTITVLQWISIYLFLSIQYCSKVMQVEFVEYRSLIFNKNRGVIF